MRYGDATAFRQALEQRLKASSDGDHARLTSTRRRILFYRFLARMAVSADDRWLLKGGLAIDLRIPGRSRTTRDVDLDWNADADAVLDTLIDATHRDVGDFIVFAVERVAIPGDPTGSRRFRVTGDLAGRRFDSFHVDVGLRRSPIDTTERIPMPDVLAFAGVPAPAVPALPIEVHAAEKLHAYTRPYESGPSTRVKDLVDLALIARHLRLDAGMAYRALRDTFRERATHDLPPAVPGPPASWSVPFRRLAGEVGLPPDPSVAHADVAQMLDPILAGGRRDGHWDPGAQRWSG